MHGGEVGEHTAQPALVHVRHAHSLGLLGHGGLRLLLGAHEEDVPTTGDDLLDKVIGGVNAVHRLLKVDNVDAVALGEDEALHLRVPAAGLVPEVDTALEELAHGHDCHDGPFVWSREVARATVSLGPTAPPSRGGDLTPGSGGWFLPCRHPCGTGGTTPTPTERYRVRAWCLRRAATRLGRDHGCVIREDVLSGPPGTGGPRRCGHA